MGLFFLCLHDHHLLIKCFHIVIEYLRHIIVLYHNALKNILKILLRNL